ncbi:hypothetical protein FHG87_023214, partial [Trinorchestia longiramus]
MYDIPFDKTIQNVVTLQAHLSAYICRHREGEEVVIFDTSVGTFKKLFSMNDCLALQSYPKCNYEHLRDFLVLPCKRKLQYITSSIDKDQVLKETFDKIQTLQQTNVFLLVDEVQIHPTVLFSGGLLSGMAENNRDCKATSILITRSRVSLNVTCTTRLTSTSAATTRSLRSFLHAPQHVLLQHHSTWYLRTAARGASALQSMLPQHHSTWCLSTAARGASALQHVVPQHYSTWCLSTAARGASAPQHG